MKSCIECKYNQFSGVIGQSVCAHPENVELAFDIKQEIIIENMPDCQKMRAQGACGPSGYLFEHV